MTALSSDAPGRLEQLRALLNTWQIRNETRQPVDDLADLVTNARGWRQRFPGVPTPPTGSTGQVIVRLDALRDSLRAALGQTHPAVLSELIDGYSWTLTLHPSGDDRPPMEIAVVNPDTVGVFVEIAVQAINDGTWHRLRSCPDCEWVFFDSSRNGRRRWCAMAGSDEERGCGSIAKARSYRQRTKTRRIGAA